MFTIIFVLLTIIPRVDVPRTSPETKRIVVYFQDEFFYQLFTAVGYMVNKRQFIITCSPFFGGQPIVFAIQGTIVFHR